MLARVYKTDAIIARVSRQSSPSVGSNGGLRYAPPPTSSEAVAYRCKPSTELESPSDLALASAQPDNRTFSMLISSSRSDIS